MRHIFSALTACIRHLIFPDLVVGRNCSISLCRRVVLDSPYMYSEKYLVASDQNRPYPRWRPSRDFILAVSWLEGCQISLCPLSSQNRPFLIQTSCLAKLVFLYGQFNPMWQRLSLSKVLKQILSSLNCYFLLF